MPQPVLPGGGQRITVDTALKQPQIIARAIQTLALERFLADTIFTRGSAQQIAGGAAVFGRAESRYMDREPREVKPRAQYPRAGWTTELFHAFVHKYGLEVPVSDEAKRRNAMDELGRAQTRLANSLVRFVDGLAVDLLLEDGDVPHVDAVGDWSQSATDIIKDLVLGRAAIMNLDEGYVPDTLVINPAEEAALMLDEGIRNALPRESSGQNALITGRPVPILGLNIVTSNRMPAGTSVILASKTVGTVADEQPTADEGYRTYTPPGATAVNVYVKTYRNDNVDETIVRAARFPAMWITDPHAALVIDDTDGGT